MQWLTNTCSGARAHIGDGKKVMMEEEKKVWKKIIVGSLCLGLPAVSKLFQIPNISKRRPLRYATRREENFPTFIFKFIFSLILKFI